MTRDRGKAGRRIAMVAACPFPANHGTPGAIRELSETLARQGHEVHVVTYPHGDTTAIEGVQIHRVSSPLGPSRGITIGPSWERLVFDALLVPKLMAVVRKHRIEIIHSHNYEATIIGACVKWATKRPLVYNGINSMADELPSYKKLGPPALARGLGTLLDRLVPRTGDAAILLSDELRDYLQRMGGDPDRMVVIPPGVDLDDFRSGDPARVRTRHGIPQGTPVVLYTGALEAFQRLDLLIRALPAVLEQHPRALLLVVNNIPNPRAWSELTALADSLGVRESIRLVESVGLAELADYLAVGDVAVIPRPNCPGFPIKLLNYMAASRAIVAFEGAAKSLCHGFNGYVAKNADVDDLARGICLLLSNDDLRATLGRRAQESLAGVYDWETLAHAIATLYEQLLGGKRELDWPDLGRYIKGSYTPRLAASGRDNPGGFLQRGPIEYASVMEARNRNVARQVAISAE